PRVFFLLSSMVLPGAWPGRPVIMDWSHQTRGSHDVTAPVKAYWLAWNREQTQIVAWGQTRAEAKAAATEAGEAEPVLENAAKTRTRFAELYKGGEQLLKALLKDEGEPLAETEVGVILGIPPEPWRNAGPEGPLSRCLGKGGSSSTRPGSSPIRGRSLALRRSLPISGSTTIIPSLTCASSSVETPVWKGRLR